MAVLKPYNNPEFFRFWAQTVLPTLYDDSLSYYEVLSKLVKWLNNTIQQLEITQENLNTVNTALEALTEEVHVLEDRVDVAEADIDALEADLKATKDRVTAAEKRLNAVEAKNTEQDNRLAAIETKDTEQDKLIKAIQELDKAQNTRLDNIEAKNTEQDTAISAAQADATKALSDAAKAQQRADDAASTAALAATAAQEAKTSATAASETAGEAMTEAASAKSTAEGVDAKATEALEKAEQALSGSAGGVTFSASFRATVNFSLNADNYLQIDWAKGLSVYVGGTNIAPADAFSLTAATGSGLMAVVMQKGATTLSTETVGLLPIAEINADSDIVLFTFQDSTPGFVFGVGCSFPLPYTVNGMWSNGGGVRYVDPAANNNLNGGADSTHCIHTNNIPYAPAGTMFQFVYSTSYNIAGSVWAYPMHFRLPAGSWTSAGTSTTPKLLSLSATTSNVSLTFATRNITFDGTVVDGITFTGLSSITFTNVCRNCVFSGVNLYTLNNGLFENCTFTGSGRFLSSATLRECTFNVNSTWTVTNCTFYNCTCSGLYPDGENTFIGGHVSLGEIRNQTDLTFYNCDVDIALLDSSSTINVSSTFTLYNCFLFELTVPETETAKATATGYGVIVPDSFQSNITTRFTNSKFSGS